jgi:hypothetical protein
MPVTIKPEDITIECTVRQQCPLCETYVCTGDAHNIGDCIKNLLERIKNKADKQYRSDE